MCLATASFYLINMHADKLEQVCNKPKFTEIETEELEQETANETLVDKKKGFWYDAFLLSSLALLAFEMYTLVPNLQSYAALPYSQVCLLYFLSI